jgi:hypothetical protein
MWTTSLVRRYAAAAVTTLSITAVALGFAASPAAASTAGILPPHNPAADCDRAEIGSTWGVPNVDSCRSKEGVGPMSLPSNWAALSVSERMFVLVNLERVNRGRAAIIGLSRSLNHLAQHGAVIADDPSFPAAGFNGGGGIWAAASSVVAADDGWMYDDGAHGLDLNLDCPYAGAAGCWGHRDIILWRGNGGPLVAGGGFSTAPGYNSYAFEVLSGYSTGHLTFTWAHELQYFKHRPKVEALRGFAARKQKSKHHKKKKKSSGGGLTITIG